MKNSLPADLCFLNLFYSVYTTNISENPKISYNNTLLKICLNCMVALNF